MTNTVEADACSSVEAAGIIGIKPATLRMWRHEGREGQPPYTRLPGRGIRYSRRKLAAWLKSREVSSDR